MKNFRISSQVCSFPTLISNLSVENSRSLVLAWFNSSLVLEWYEALLSMKTLLRQCKKKKKPDFSGTVSYVQILYVSVVLCIVNVTDSNSCEDPHSISCSTRNFLEWLVSLFRYISPNDVPSSNVVCLLFIVCSTCLSWSWSWIFSFLCFSHSLYKSDTIFFKYECTLLW